MLVIPNHATITKVGKQSRIKLRQLSYCILLLCGANAQSAHAVRLGELQAQSYLGQSLRASVPILGGAIDSNFLKCVKAQFIKLDGTFVMPLRVDISNNGRQSALTLSSSARIEDPAFTVKLETTCEEPVTREYQILLDPEDTLAPPLNGAANAANTPNAANVANAANPGSTTTRRPSQRKPGNVLKLEMGESAPSPVKAASKALAMKFGRSDSDLKLRLSRRLQNDSGPLGMASQETFSEIVRQQQNQSALIEVARAEIKSMQEKMQSLEAEIRRLKENQVRNPAPAPAPTPAAIEPPAPLQTPVQASVQPEAPVRIQAQSEAASQAPGQAPSQAARPDQDARPANVTTPSFIPGGVATLAAISLAAFLIALFLYRKHKRTSTPEYETSSLLKESGMEANSMFATRGGLNIDTTSSVFNSNFTPSASQLDTNEVDPVAEADVYIAYGRDTEAEEILKEALRTQPERNAVRLKLLEIYAHRKDTRAFEVQAGQLYSFTNGEGDDWAQAASMWMSIDPTNPLFSGANSDFTEDLASPAAEKADLGENTRPVVFVNSKMEELSSIETNTEAPGFANTRPWSGSSSPDAMSANTANTRQTMLQVNEHGDLDFDLDLPTQLQTEVLDYNLDDIHREAPAAEEGNSTDSDTLSLEPVPSAAKQAESVLETENANQIATPPDNPVQLPPLNFEPAFAPHVDLASQATEPEVLEALDAPDEPQEEPEVIMASLPVEEDQIYDFDLLNPPESSPTLGPEPVAELTLAPSEPVEPEISADDFFAKLELDTEDDAPIIATAMPGLSGMDAGLDIIQPENEPTIEPTIEPTNEPTNESTHDATSATNLHALNAIANIQHEKIDAIALRGDDANDNYSVAKRVEMDTKLDLAIEYQGIGYKEGARELIHEVIRGGTPAQVASAKEMLASMT